MIFSQNASEYWSIGDDTIRGESRYRNLADSNRDRVFTCVRFQYGGYCDWNIVDEKRTTKRVATPGVTFDAELFGQIGGDEKIMNIFHSEEEQYGIGLSLRFFGNEIFDTQSFKLL